MKNASSRGGEDQGGAVSGQGLLAGGDSAEVAQVPRGIEVHPGDGTRPAFTTDHTELSCWPLSGLAYHLSGPLVPPLHPHSGDEV